MKKPPENKYSSREGGALLMVMLAVVFVVGMSLGLLKLRETDMTETVFVEDHKQAFWMAESGLTDGEVLLQHNIKFRENPTAVPTMSVAGVNGSYDISVTKTTVDITLDLHDYTIVSDGTVNGVTRRLSRSIRSYPGGKYAIVGIDGHTDLASNVEVLGPIAQIAGTMYVHDSRLLDDYIIMGDGEGSLKDKKGEATLANYPPPPAPTIDSSDYHDYLTKANLSSPSNYPAFGNVVMSGTHIFNNINPIEFGGKTVIRDGTTIVAVNGIDFSKSGVRIGQNVTIITGSDVTFKVQAAVDAGSQIYAEGNIHFESGSKLNTGDESVLLLSKSGDIIMDSNFDFRGVMFAETGQVQLNANGTIDGAVIGGVGVDADAQMTIAYDETVFTDGTPIIPLMNADAILVQTAWQEVPYP